MMIPYAEFRKRLDALTKELQTLQDSVRADIELLPGPNGLRVMVEVRLRDIGWIAAYPTAVPVCVQVFHGVPPRGKTLSRDDLLHAHQVDEFTPEQAFGLAEVLASIKKWVDGDDLLGYMHRNFTPEAYGRIVKKK